MKKFYSKFKVAIITFILGLASFYFVQNLDLLVIPDKNDVQVLEVVEFII